MAVVFLQAPLAVACGHCVEDKIAAVYDHAVVTRTHARGGAVVFFAIEGSLAPDAQRAIEDAARTAPGVDKDSVRVSVDQAALSLAYDPRKTSSAAVGKAVAARLARKQLKLEELKVLQPVAATKGAAQ